MSTIKRKSRQRVADRDPLISAWQAGDPPPSWAHEPGDHHDEIIGLYFFRDFPDQRDAQTHPHREAWAAAMKSSMLPAGRTTAP